MLNNKVTGGAVALLSIALGKKTIEYERIVYSFIDMFGFLGGLYDFMYITGFIWFMFFQNRVFNFTIFSSLYHVEVEPKEDKSFEINKITPSDILVRDRPSLISCNKILNPKEGNKEEDDKELEYTISPSINPYMQTDHEKVLIEDDTVQKVK